MSSRLHFALFGTAVGECAIAWGDAGVTGVWLPEPRPGGLRRRLARSQPGAVDAEPPQTLAAVITTIRRLLDGDAVDLGDVRLDLRGVPDFAQRVYAVTRAIPPGRVLTYAAVAERVGAGAAARAVGQALGANPFPIVVPCHRVVAAAGQLGGFSAPGGTTLKQRLLAIEKARPDGPPGLFDRVEEEGASPRSAA